MRNTVKLNKILTKKDLFEIFQISGSVVFPYQLFIYLAFAFWSTSSTKQATILIIQNF